MEESSLYQSIVDQMATNFASRLAELEAERAILQVKNKKLEQKISQLKSDEKEEE
jgi:hypothetical protein